MEWIPLNILEHKMECRHSGPLNATRTLSWAHYSFSFHIVPPYKGFKNLNSAILSSLSPPTNLCFSLFLLKKQMYRPP